MKLIVKILGGVVFLFSLVFFVQGKTKGDDSWKNFYCIVWDETPANALTYAKQMGYDYLAVKTWPPIYYTNNPDYAGLKFYVVDPQNMAAAYVGIPDNPNLDDTRVIDTTKTYTQAQKDWYKSHMVWKSKDPWPDNFATSIYPDVTKPYRFDVMWDFQQQVVIDELVNNIIAMFHAYENLSLPFTFAGYGMDTPLLYNEFRHIDSTGKQVRHSLSYWTGKDSGVLHTGITQNYETYTEGVFAFHKQLSSRMKQEFPNAKWFLDPYWIYSSTRPDEWVYLIKDRPDKDTLTPDMILQEGAVGTDTLTAFVDEPLNFNSGVSITKDMVGCEQRNEVAENANRIIAAKAGINGSWYNWFGQFGGIMTMPRFNSITEVYPRLKLIRCIPNWDNLNNVPLNDRSWNGRIYKSPNGFISSDVMYSRHPKTGKLFAVFLTTNGIVKLKEGESVTSVKRADGFFMEASDGIGDVKIVRKGLGIRLKSGVTVDVDSNNGQVKGNGYIFTLTTQTGVPQVLTKLAKIITSSSATLRGVANANGLTTEVWFQYGTVSGSYDANSSIKTIYGSLDNNISIKTSGFSSQTTYYYRIAASNTAGTTYGEEKKFTTQ